MRRSPPPPGQVREVDQQQDAAPARGGEPPGLQPDFDPGREVENWFLNVPGLKLAVPGTPADAYSLLRGAVEDDDPVLFFEHKAMLNMKGEVPDQRPSLALGQAAVVRQGSDVTLVATQLARLHAEEAAATLASEGISAEVIDPRTVSPLDMQTINRSVEKTGRLVVAEESPAAGSSGATVLANATAAAFDSLDAPPVLVSSDETPVPHAGPLERAWIPSAERIADAVRSLG